MLRKTLILRTKQVICGREERAAKIGLSNDFMEGFREGAAETLAAILREPAADLLEEITE